MRKIHKRRVSKVRLPSGHAWVRLVGLHTDGHVVVRPLSGGPRPII